MNIRYCFFHVYVLEFLILKSIQQKLEYDYTQLNDINELTKLLMNVFEKCLKNESTRNVVIAHDNMISIKMISTVMPIRLIGYEENLSEFLHKEEPGNNFVIYASSALVLSTALQMLKKSIWWNYEGLFLLINRRFGGCEMASTLLDLIWSFNVLSTILLCYNFDHRLELYTFNPFNDFAPKLWKATGNENAGKNRWTMFKISFLNLSYPRICKNLFFDKTRELKGYTINMGAYVHSHLLTYNPNNTGLYRFSGVNGDITRTICDHINATANVKFYSSMGIIDDHGKLQSFIKDLQLGNLDFAMNMNMLRPIGKQQTYPHETSGFCMVSLKEPITFLEKFTLVFPAQSWLALVVILISSIFALKLLLKRTLLFAGFEFFRMFLNIPSSKITPQDSTRRLIFLQILIITMITNSIFQSRLNSINVVVHNQRFIETIEDLINSNQFIYGTLPYKDLFPDKKISQHRFQLSEYPDCIERLLRKEHVICISGCIEARFKAYEGNEFHISKKELIISSMVFSTREDWPMLSRFNRILRKLSETGFIKFFRKRETRHFKRSPENRKIIPKISIQSLAFGFVFLLTGLSLGVVSLVIEIIIFCAGKYNLKKSLFNKVYK